MFAVETPPPTPSRLAFCRHAGFAALAFAATMLGNAPAAVPEISDHPLAPRSGPRGATLFTTMAPEATGIVTENKYDDPAMWDSRYHEFEVGSIGTGVAIGDYDGDGKPDVFVVSKTESCRLFRNLGNWKFRDVTAEAGVEDRGAAAKIWKQGATFVDINNDGRLDLYVCRNGAPNLLYVNQGDGTFKEMAHAYGLDITDGSVMAAFGDYDRDGWLDVYIVTNLLHYALHPNGQRHYLLHNNRDGTFTDVSDQSGISREPTQGHSAIWWDYDNDGWPDLYVANDFSAPDRLYHNNRDGTFAEVIDQVVPHMPFSAMGSDVGDVNNDGRLDLIVGEMAASSHEKDQRGMVNTRAQAIEPPEGSPAAQQVYHNALYLNTGTGRCLEAAFLAGVATTDWTWSLRFEDLDNDGRVDLFVTNGMHRESTNADLLARQMRAESAAERLRIMRDSPVMAESNLAFRNAGNLQFENVSAAWGLNQRGVSFGAAFGDLDGDGDLDLVYANYQHGITVLRNDCDTGHRIEIDLRGTVSNRFGVGAVVSVESASGKQVRELTLARGYASSSEPMVHFGLGDDGVVDRLTVTWPNGFTQTFAHLAVDRRYMITEPTNSRATAASTPTTGRFTDVSQATGLALASHEQAVDEAALQPLVPLRFNRRGPALAAGQIDRVGDPGIVIGGTTVDPIRVLRPGPDGAFTAVDEPDLSADTAADDGPILLFDANGDGANDLLVTKGGANLPAGSAEYQPRLYLNDGAGRFRLAPAGSLPPLPISAGAVAAADFNHDGRPDIFIGGRVSPGDYPRPPHSALLVNRGGKFTDATAELAPELADVGMVSAALWSDIDGDGWPDLIIALDWGQVKCFHNVGGRRFEDWSDQLGFSAAGNGCWTALASADFNGDGRPDYVVGNLGLNTPYQGDAEHPVVMLYGDFKGDGTSQLVEAAYEGDRLVPRRSRRDLGAIIPSILRRYPRNDAFARATLSEILGSAAVNAATRFEASELRSGVFLSQPDGKYRFQPLPRIVQVAPTQALVVGDFDGDGNADIVAVQNSYAPVPSVGRFDGGLGQLLRGDGHGGFEPEPPAESGIVVPGDAKALIAFDLDGDGWTDLVTTRNNATMLAFRNRGAAGKRR